jgi:hypothetical protein
MLRRGWCRWWRASARVANAFNPSSTMLTILHRYAYFKDEAFINKQASIH